MRVRALVAYDGTCYGGFQRQRNAPSVQQALEAALAQVTGCATPVVAAGRTDAGVHAQGQVIACDTEWRHGLGDLQRALNAVLPEDVAVRELELAAPGFHPRYDALSRCYRYTITNAAVRSPLTRRYSLHVPEPLDVVALERAAQALLGEHDFAAFGRATHGAVTIRRVLRAEWTEWPQEARLTFDIEANAFLYRMVRLIVGSLLKVGRGRLDSADVAEILAARDRRRAGPAAPACGLSLLAVRY